jgi:hypothetical protein
MIVMLVVMTASHVGDARLVDCGPASAASRCSNRSRLLNQLHYGYDAGSPPEHVGIEGLQVEIQFALQSIIEVSTATETLKMQGWWRTYWASFRGSASLSFQTLSLTLDNLE